MHKAAIKQIRHVFYAPPGIYIYMYIWMPLISEIMFWKCRISFIVTITD